MIYINGSTVGSFGGEIRNINLEKTTARPEFVVKGKFFYDEKGLLQEGTLEPLSGADIHIRFSEHEDGTNFSKTWSEGKKYIGYALAKASPTSKSGYTWVKFIN